MPPYTKFTALPSQHPKQQKSAPSTATQTPKSLSPRQLLELQKGPQVAVYVGDDLSTRVVAISGGVYKNVLAHFSPYCKQVLVKEKKDILWLEMSGNKEALKFAIKWMSAGGWDVQRQLPAMNASTLIDLYRFSIKLEVSALGNESQRLLGPAISRLNIPNALNFYNRCKDLNLEFAQQKAENRLCYLLRQTTLEVHQVKFVYENTPSGSTIRTTVVKRLTAAFRWEDLEIQSYWDFSEGNEEFKEDMVKVAPVTCGHCKKTGHSESTCFKLHPEQNPNAAPKFLCAHCNKPYHTEAKCWKLHPELVPQAIQAKRNHQQANKSPPGRKPYTGGQYTGAGSNDTASLAQFFKLKKNQAFKPIE
ncbi:MAG: hypothetical protein M1812_002687 [Candelaria pacifica]|nr:MAG: hypothetical protein M1812_002687 [Candelaria pacifica]